jgi:hypothetical protein
LVATRRVMSLARVAAVRLSCISIELARKRTKFVIACQYRRFRELAAG